MGERESYWLNQWQWPADPYGYVFLFRAVHRIGRALFGDAWTGGEPSTEYPRPLYAPLLGKPNVADARRAEELLTKHRPELLARLGREPFPLSLNNRSTLRPTVPVFRSEEWDVAVALAQAELQEAAPRLRRFARVKQVIARAGESGALAFSARPVRGGAMYVVPREHWNTDNWEPRFTIGQYNPSDPYGAAFAGEKFYCLFVEEESLATLVVALSGAPVAESAAGPEATLSPYLRFMLALSRRLNLSPENQIPKAALEAEIKNAWRGDPPLSERLVQAMATLMREPESQLGRNRGRKQG